MVFPAEIYAARRRAFMDRIGSQAAALLAAPPVSVRSNDVEYPYRQHSDLLYLTGFPEPECVCLLIPGRPNEEFVMFVQPRDAERETWTGRRTGVDGAREIYEAQVAYPIDKLDDLINEYVGGRDRLYYAFGHDSAFNERVLGWLRQWQQLRPRTGAGPMATLDPGDVLHEMRLVKGDEEIVLMRRAQEITGEAHVAAMRSVRPGWNEYEVEALVDYTFRRNGASGPAYPSICAGGANATVLHYTSNSGRVSDGDLLLIDAGAEYGGYCADVTRTFPLGPRFTPPQRAIYELVLSAQAAAIAAVQPGVPFDAPHAAAIAVLVDGLQALGLLSGERQELIDKEAYRPFYMHRTSHWLGMDVHDVGQYKVQGAVRVLEPGMVLTVEPGLYIRAEREDVDPAYRGIGVRIEDDVLVTPTAHEVLSGAIPKQVAEIEALREEAG
jgi:Xaa-Pro aminopeptidase